VVNHRHIVPALLLAFALVATPAASARVAVSTHTSSEQAVAKLINKHRAKKGLRALKIDGSLITVARAHSRDMIKRNYFSHRSKSGTDPSDRIARAGGLGAIGEDLAWGTGSYATPSAIVKLWLNSPPHRRVLFAKDLRYVGIGRATGRFQGYSGAAVFTADFSARVR
jgi:uncharacterized protein YkwD